MIGGKASYVVDGETVFCGTVLRLVSGFDRRGTWGHGAWAVLQEEGTQRRDEVLAEMLVPA